MVCNFIEKRLRHMCFPKNLKDILRTPILQNAERLLLLKYLLKVKIAARDKFSEAAVITIIIGKHLCWSLFLIKL